jgi:hypothetical protein
LAKLWAAIPSVPEEKRARRVLREAGFGDIALKPHRFDLDIALRRWRIQSPAGVGDIGAS